MLKLSFTAFGSLSLILLFERKCDKKDWNYGIIGLGYNEKIKEEESMIKFKKIEHDPRKYFPELIEMFKKDKEVTVVYLFGSYAGGNIGPLSDIDLAILLRSDFPSESYFDKQLDLLLKASNILRTDEVDVVILNRAPFSFAYSVLKQNKLLFCRDDSERVKFQTKIVDGYLDFKPFLEENYRYLHRRIKEGRFGVRP